MSKMWKPAVLVALIVGCVSCSITCPDGKQCSDFTTCCETTHGYACCHYPQAVCCSDLSHCCPFGFRCNTLAQTCERAGQPWLTVPMREKLPAEEASVAAIPASALVVSDAGALRSQMEDNGRSSVVHCDSQTICPDGTTCCRHPKGPWFCCGYSPGKCCLDGYHCCPYGYDCDLTYTHCIRQGLRYPFTPKLASQVVPATYVSESQVQDKEVLMARLTQAEDSGPQSGVIRCDDYFYCQPGNSCCKGTTGKWACCPYPLGKCCSDGMHCCEYGYTCDPLSAQCRKWFT